MEVIQHTHEVCAHSTSKTRSIVNLHDNFFTRPAKLQPFSKGTNRQFHLLPARSDANDHNPCLRSHTEKGSEVNRQLIIPKYSKIRSQDIARCEGIPKW